MRSPSWSGAPTCLTSGLLGGKKATVVVCVHSFVDLVLRDDLPIALTITGSSLMSTGGMVSAASQRAPPLLSAVRNTGFSGVLRW